MGKSLNPLELVGCDEVQCRRRHRGELFDLHSGPHPGGSKMRKDWINSCHCFLKTMFLVLCVYPVFF